MVTATFCTASMPTSSKSTGSGLIVIERGSSACEDVEVDAPVADGAGVDVELEADVGAPASNVGISRAEPNTKAAKLHISLVTPSVRKAIDHGDLTMSHPGE
jgi:hypothetical protein